MDSMNATFEEFDACHFNEFRKLDMINVIVWCAQFQQWHLQPHAALSTIRFI
ncbi:hypothetical protein [Colwellia sp. C1TZA3]|uniref:hypothetical protein n=1 Tax=Colwellia sp. C1TZA3 TaxID=2508879 RepID=UPI00174D0406|nr:hypothetical protein [Colwellia sp. C1TZA3]